MNGSINQSSTGTRAGASIFEQRPNTTRSRGSKRLHCIGCGWDEEARHDHLKCMRRGRVQRVPVAALTCALHPAHSGAQATAVGRLGVCEKVECRESQSHCRLCGVCTDCESSASVCTRRHMQASR
mmetsp:Transcript_1984/g.5604  ORF Transcript_1984/g.5604 Transcript_1984/m.5604 type:complete len:126 (+) Transcript_1984:467-844(+)